MNLPKDSAKGQVDHVNMSPIDFGGYSPADRQFLTQGLAEAGQPACSVTRHEMPQGEGGKALAWIARGQGDATAETLAVRLQVHGTRDNKSSYNESNAKACAKVDLSRQPSIIWPHVDTGPK